MKQGLQLPTLKFYQLSLQFVNNKSYSKIFLLHGHSMLGNSLHKVAFLQILKFQAPKCLSAMSSVILTFVNTHVQT